MEDEKTKKPEPTSEPPSIEFEDAFCDSGSIRCYCDGCGRTFFNYMEGPNFDPGELEELEAEAGKDSDKYVGVDHTIGNIWLMGHNLVVGCPCNKIRVFEDFILNNKYKIKRYFEMRADFLEKAAAVSSGIVEAIERNGDES